MPRAIKGIKVLAICDRQGFYSYITEDRQKFYDSHEFMACLLANPHKERYIIRAVSAESWNEQDWVWNDISKEQFMTYFTDLSNFTPYITHSVPAIMEAFDALFERGSNIW